MEAIEILRTLYKEQFNLDEILVELMADKDILHLTASGTSNKSISNLLDINLEDIETANKNFYGFPGWSKDTDLNPLSIYSNMVKLGYTEYGIFKHELEILSPNCEEQDIKLMFETCSKFKTIETLLNDDWV